MGSIRAGLRGGLITAGINIFLVLIGVTTLMGTLVSKWFGLDSLVPGAWLTLCLVAFWGGTMAVRRLKKASWRGTLSAGLIAGVTHAAPLAAFTALLASLASQGMDVRQWLAQLSETTIGLITLGRSPEMAAGVMFAVSCTAVLAGSLFAHLRASRLQSTRFGSWIAQKRTDLLHMPAVNRALTHPLTRPISLGLCVLLLLIAPFFLGQYWNYTLGTVGIYVILGLGLNIVVGMAGLLDLGYVAFFAVGAYTVAILTAPQPNQIMWDFWAVLPIGVLLAMLSGVLLGIPVLRMRGDYLAIVTLGFGEIIRILTRSEVFIDVTGGPRGIRAIGHPKIFGYDIGNEFYFLYFILLGILLVMFLTRRLENSRVGRAWRAMREDERVAEAVGIYTLKYKLLAFAIGAAFAGFGGIIFASRNSFAGPEDFTLLVSINVLALVIVGGMGSIPGIIVGAFVLKGLPEILRELQDYRILAFGALLVAMMILRPQGLWPSARPQLERRKGSVPEPASIETSTEHPQGDGA